MQQSLPLFDSADDFRHKLAAKLSQLASQGIYLGGSSWKYPGWIGSIYSADKYRLKGRFSKPTFEQECLLEYADTFPVVCGDFAFYQFPTRAFWQKLFQQVPPPFLFAFKAPEEITSAAFPNIARYGSKAGTRNPGFLDAAFFRTQFLDLLRPYQSRVAVVIFEFGAALQKYVDTAEALAEKLDQFFSSLPNDVRFAVELRVPDFLSPAYFAALQKHGIAHVFNAWSGMPEVSEQMSMPGCFTAPFTVSRALLRKGRPYDESVSKFAPYSELREPNAEVRNALRDLLIRAKRRAEPTFIFVNNRLEGFAPGTIAAVIEDL